MTIDSLLSRTMGHRFIGRSLIGWLTASLVIAVHETNVLAPCNLAVQRSRTNLVSV